MELWFTERHTPYVNFSIKVERQLYTAQSEFQRIDVFESREFGRFLTLDGYMMLTEKDEFIYHEMITHIPMAVHPNPENILVIGAGDGGVVRELTRYQSPKCIDLVEIDELAIKVERQLYTAQSEFQRIDVFESREFGRFLTLDGYMMLTEKDEFIYHEMITHIPMAVHPNPENILVIGAGDGGVVRELTRYQSPKCIDLVEIDELVIEVCRKYLPKTACRLDDPRVHIHIADGLKFIRSCENKYDLIIVDSTDPFGPGEGLFTKEFYGSCYNALREDGIMVNQHESPFYAADAAAMQRAHKRIVECFPISRVYQAHIPTYPSGHWLFGFASKKYHPVTDFNPTAWTLLGLSTRYYNAKLHRSAFSLPTYVEELLRDVEPQ